MITYFCVKNNITYVCFKNYYAMIAINLKKQENLMLMQIEMLLNNCEINVIRNWSGNFLIVPITVANQGPTLAITSTQLYVLVVTLSTQVNI